LIVSEFWEAILAHTFFVPKFSLKPTVRSIFDIKFFCIHLDKMLIITQNSQVHYVLRQFLFCQTPMSTVELTFLLPFDKPFTPLEKRVLLTPTLVHTVSSFRRFRFPLPSMNKFHLDSLFKTPFAHFCDELYNITPIKTQQLCAR
jgi:hypothetical protein